MSDRRDARMRAFVAELLDDPPIAPPFPHQGMVVIKGDHRVGREPMIDTQTREDKTDRPRRWRGPSVAVGAFVAVLVIVAAVFAATAVFDDPGPVVSSDDPGPVIDSDDPGPVINSDDGAAALIGTTGRVVDGAALSRPNSIEFGEDGTYRVIDAGIIMDTGVYETDGDVITFESAPTDEVMWVRNDMEIRMAHTCEGFVGEYRVTFQDESLYTFDAIWDECPNRIAAANGLQLEVVSD